MKRDDRAKRIAPATRLVGSAAKRRKAAFSLIGLGKSGLSDVSERVDEYLAQAISSSLDPATRPGTGCRHRGQQVKKRLLESP